MKILEIISIVLVVSAFQLEMLIIGMGRGWNPILVGLTNGMIGLIMIFGLRRLWDRFVTPPQLSAVPPPENEKVRP